MANFFDQFDEASKSGNFFDQFDEKPDKKEKKSTIGSELVRGGKQLASSIQTGAEALFGTPEEAALAGIERGRKISEEAGEGVSLEAIKRAYEKEGLLSAAGEVVGQIPRALAGQGAQLAAMAAAAKAGAMAGTAVAPGVGTVIGGALGAGASLLPQFLGANVERQVQEQIEAGQAPKVDLGRAGAAAAGQAAIEGAGTAFVLGKRVVKGVLGIADDAALATAKAQQEMVKAAERTMLQAAGRGAARGTTEIPVEVAQQVLERAQAGLDVTSPEALSEYGEAAYQAALVGGPLGAVSGPVDTAMARQARTQIQQAEAEQEKQRVAKEQQAELQRLAAERAAEEERMRPIREAEARVPAEEPVGPSITRTGRAALLEGEDPLAAAIRARREAEEAKAEVPLGEDYEFLQREKQRLLAEEPTKENRAQLKRIEDQILGILQRNIEWRPGGPEAVRASVFGEAELPTPITREQLMAPKIEPFKPATTVPRSSLLGAAPAGGGVADLLAARREAEAAQAEVPLSEDYAFLTREKNRLSALPKTPENTAAIGRIDEEIRRLDTQAVERRRRDAEAAKTSVFAQEQLPPIESRGAVVAERDLQEMQAKEGSPELTDFELQQAKRTARMAGKPAPATESDLELKEKQKELMALEAERNKIKTGGNLYKMLEGQLDPSDVSDISKDIKKLYGKGYKPLAKQQGQGTFISELVSDGILNNFLPPNMRPGSSAFDLQNSTEFIKDKLRNKDTRSYGAQMQGRELDARIEQLRNEVEGPARVQAEVADIEPGEAAAIERTAGDAEVLEVLPDLENLRYQRAGIGGKSIGKEQTQSVVDAVKSQWKNAPEVVVAENMDDTAIPAEVREHNRAAMQRGATGSPRGFFYKGKAYVLADAATSPTQVMETLFHEALGHYGLRGTFGPEMESVLKDVVKYRRAEVEAKAKQYGLDPKSESDMLEAAEEVLAEIAQTKPGLSFVKRAIAVIRNFLRDLGLPFKMSNEDIIQKYILPARAFVEKGGSKAVEGKPAAMREIQNMLAGWTDDRIARLIKENGYPGGKTKAYAAYVIPDEFVNATTPTSGRKKEIEKEAGKLDLTKIRSESQTPFLFINQINKGQPNEEWEIVGHEGRHRMAALSSAGVQRAPVVLIMQENGFKSPDAYEPVTDVQVAGQSFDTGTGLDIDVFDAIPINEKYSAELKAQFGKGDIRYQREAEPEPKQTRLNIAGEPVLGSWNIQVDPKLELQDGLIYKFLDKNIDVKRIVESIEKLNGEIAQRWNPYLQEELYHGRTAAATQEFADDEWQPLLKEMDKLDVTIGELEQYLHNRHAEDYNKLVAKRNPTRPEMQDGGSQIKTEDARKYLADLSPERKKKYEALAKRIDAITKGTRELLVKNGYETPERIEAWEKAFPNYVPLMREEEDFDYNFGSFGTGRGFDVRRDFSRSAMGSKRQVVDIIGNIIAARNNAIMLTEKNRVAQAVYGLAVQNPNPDFWLAVNPDAEKQPADVIEELNRMGIDEDDFKNLAKEPLQRSLDPKTNKVISRVNDALRKNNYVLATRINGERRYVFFNPKDERSKRAVTALKNLDAENLGMALGAIAKVTRWMAAVNTQYNPIFGIYNFLRDTQAAALQLSTTPLAGKQIEVSKEILPSLRAIYGSLRKRHKGEKVDTEMAQLWREFQKEGGQTGFKDVFSRTQDRQEALVNEMMRIKEGKTMKAGRAIVDWLSDYNDTLENAVRLSAYKVAKKKFIDEGKTETDAKQLAASLAKNLTVNFNRKGDAALQAGALYAFFNASMQGTARAYQTLKGPMGKKILAGGLLWGVIQASIYAFAGFDEEEPPEFVRERNIVIPTGDGDYLAFPMPLGYHVIPGVSRIISEWALSGFRDTPDRIASLTGMFLEAFNPIGNAGWSVQTLAPTFADPLVALSENKDWTGKPIARKDFSNMDPTPGYTRAKDTASEFSTQIAKFLNYASGGTEFRPGVLSPTPDQIDYLIGQAFGGLGREATKLEQTVLKTATGEELPPYKIPLVGRFYGETKSSAAESNRFYKNLTLLNEHENEIKGRRDKGQPIGDYLKDNPEARLAPMARKTYKDIQQLRKRREQLVERDAPRESVKAVEEQIKRRMAMFNDRVAQLKD